MPTYEEYTQGTLQIIKESEVKIEEYEVEILGKTYVVFPNVFSPKYFRDTEFFAETIPVEKGEDFLEIGPGTGIISVTAALKGAGSVTAVDINLDAVRNTVENAKRHGIEDKVTIYQGDVYSPLTDQKFDTIFWNTPFAFVENEDISVLEKAVLDPGYKSTKRFVNEAEQYLKPGGKLLIGFSTTLGRFDVLEQYLEKAGYEIKLLNRTESVEVNPIYFELFEAKRRKLK